MWVMTTQRRAYLLYRTESTCCPIFLFRHLSRIYIYIIIYIYLRSSAVESREWSICCVICRGCDRLSPVFPYSLLLFPGSCFTRTASRQQLFPSWVCEKEGEAERRGEQSSTAEGEEGAVAEVAAAARNVVGDLLTLDTERARINNNTESCFLFLFLFSARLKDQRRQNIREVSYFGVRDNKHEERREARWVRVNETRSLISLLGPA